MDSRPDCVYGILVRDGRVFVGHYGNGRGLPGGVFRPLAEDRKVELAQHLEDQLGIFATTIWAQGAFDYQHPVEERRKFSGFYSVWDWEGDVPAEAGEWADIDGIAALDIVPSLRILLTSVLSTHVVRTR
jgi:hypothetical protein